VHTPGAKTRERICTIDRSKRVKSAKDVPFRGFRQKNFTQPHQPPNSENFALQKQFFAQSTYKSWRKRYQNSFLKFNISGNFPEVSAKAWKL